MTHNVNESRYGHLWTDDGYPVVEWRRHLPFAIDVVWLAMTEPDHLSAWFPSTIDGERTSGASLKFRFTQVDVPVTTGAMDVFDPDSHVMELTWGDERLRFELRPEGSAHTVLTLIVTLSEIGKAARDAAGWHVCLDILEEHVAGESTDYTNGDAWRKANRAYVAQFPESAATIGPPQEWVDEFGNA
jgi:uncharacterized protein YndB with AHSA1/START domain